MEDPRAIVLSLCDLTGNMLRPWADSGLYRCIAVDTEHPDSHGGAVGRTGGRQEGYIEYVRADVREYLPPPGRYAACFAFPPCTHLAVSGARWMQSKGLSALIEALQIVEACRRLCEWTGAPYLLENPVSTLSTYWRKPDFMFDPWEYGAYCLESPDTYAKRTCLWTGGGFVMPPKRAAIEADEVDTGYIHRMVPGPERANLRSATPMGFARAVYEVNAGK